MLDSHEIETCVLREGSWSELKVGCLAVRRQVFQEEQSVPASLDQDGLDEASIHILVESRSGVPLGTARIYKNHLQRLAVVPQAREQGIGFLLVASMIRVSFVQGFDFVDGTAQTAALGLARLFGFTIGDEILEIAGIEHRSVYKRIR